MTLVNTTAWTLIHFLWQGAIVVAVFAIADAMSRRASARVRYALASAAMVALLACPVATFVYLMDSPTSTAVVSLATMTPHAVMTIQHEAHAPAIATFDYLPWLVYFWIAGVAALSARMAAQWIMLQRCRRQGVRVLDEAWQDRIHRIVRRLELTRVVTAYESAIADVPSVIGWLRPVVLVPTSALLQLTPSQIEALLTHELAHVRRHDYLVNLLQSCVETLFFYHPGVWWVGRRMREERENCCDDLAVAVCGDAMIYARALADLEQSRSSVPALAMAANGGSLLNRIERLIAPRKTAQPPAPVGITALSVIVAAAFVWAAPPAASNKPEPVLAMMAYQAPTPAPAPAAQKPKPSPSPSATPTPTATKPAPSTGQGSYLDQLERAGLTNLTVDQMIAMKIHGVTGDYVNEMKALGWSPTPDQFITFRIHGVDAATVKELRGLGFTVSPDDAVSARIHGVDAAWVKGWKQLGVKGLDFDHLIALRIHGADPAQLQDLKTLGFSDLSADDLVNIRIAEVTPDFIREVQKRGFRNLRLEQIIQLRHMGILDSKESK